MPLRILVAGGLREPGPWDAFARSVGEALAARGLALSLLTSSGFGRAAAEGYRKVAPPHALRAHHDEPGDAPSALAGDVVTLLPPKVAGDGLEQALREADVLLLAGHGRHLREIAGRALGRRLPLVALPIPNTTSEEVWEENLQHFPRVAVPVEVRTGLLSRKLDPRSRAAATTFAAHVAALAGAPELPGGPHVLVYGPAAGAAGAADAAAAGGDDVATVLRRALRTTAPGARVEAAPSGWLRSPGRALADAVKGAGLVVVDAAAEAGAWYALGLARGAGRPVVALARREGRLPLDPGALDLLLWEDDRDLAARLERRLRESLPRPTLGGAPPPARRGASAGRGRKGERGPRPEGGGRGRRRGGKGRGPRPEPPAPAQNQPQPQPQPEPPRDST